MKKKKRQLPTSVPGDFQKQLNLLPDPRMQIIVTCGFVELLVNTLIEAKCRHGKRILDSRDFTLSVRLILLREIGVIDDPWFKMLDWLRDIRNSAAHDAVFGIDALNDLQLFRELAAQFPDSFPRDSIPVFLDPNNPDNLKFVCTGIVFGFWVRHEEIFAKTLPY
jgi:hypothetical protein